MEPASSELQQQAQEIAGASMAQDDFDLAYRLQLEEALRASCNDHGLPDPNPNPNPNPNPSSCPRRIPVPEVLEDGETCYDLSPPDRSLAIALQNLEISRSQQEARDRRLAETQSRALEQQHVVCTLDHKLAEILSRFGNSVGGDSGFEEGPSSSWMRAAVAAAAADDDDDDDEIHADHGLYVTSIMASVDSNPDLPLQPLIGAVITEPCSGAVVHEVQKTLDSGIGKTVADYMAFIEGLEAALALQLQSLVVYTDSVIMYNQVTGRWKIRSKKVQEIHGKVMQLLHKLEQFDLELIPRNENGLALKLAREALYSTSVTDKKETCRAEDQEAKEDCTICFEGKTLSEMIVIPDCTHIFCRSCIVQHSEVKVQSGQVPIRCPQVNCTQTLSLTLSKSILSTKWYELLNKRMIEANMPEAERVYCPYPKCSALMSRETLKVNNQRSASSSSASSLVTSASCVECFRMFCVECRVPWHVSMTCQQYQKLPPIFKDAQDANLYKLAENQKWQRCRKCRRMIELAEGCFHMTCRCGYEFCYLCGEPWKDNRQSCKCRLWDEVYLLNNPLAEPEDEEDPDNDDAAFSDYDDLYEDSEDFNELNVRYIRERSPPRNNPYYKTQLCRYWATGGCNRGADCNFAHGALELRDNQGDRQELSPDDDDDDDDDGHYDSNEDSGEQDDWSRPSNYKTQLCRYWEKTGCNRGDACSFAHGVHELRGRGSSDEHIW